MANRRLAPAAEQPASFAFTPGNAGWARGQVGTYTSRRQTSARLPLLWEARDQVGRWLPQTPIEASEREVGVYLVAAGTNRPDRSKTPALGVAHVQAMDLMCRGHLLADASCVLGTRDIVFGEVDR